MKKKVSNLVTYCYKTDGTATDQHVSVPQRLWLPLSLYLKDFVTIGKAVVLANNQICNFHKSKPTY